MIKKIEEAYKLVSESSPETTDCHELMTACLCTLELQEIEDLISKVEENQSYIGDVLQKISEIARSNSIVGADESEIQSISLYKYKELALVQALSAAREIIKQNSGFRVQSVVMTGKSWTETISRFAGIKNLKDNFDINSYGMKDFNSSDIVLIGKEGSKDLFVGISLKKKKTGEKKDPTVINRSLFTTLPEDSVEPIELAFDEFFNTSISEINFEDLVVDETVFQNLINKEKQIAGKFPGYLAKEDFADLETLKSRLSEICRTAKDSENKKLWKTILSPSYGLMSTHNNRVQIRKMLNPKLASSNSPFKEIIKTIEKESVSDFVAYSLLETIFKGQLEILKSADFRFALCTGTGKYGVKIGASVGPASYIPIEKITSLLDQLREFGKPTLKFVGHKQELSESTETQIITEDEDSDDSHAISLFFNLNIGSEKLANVTIRFKGKYTSSPNILATFSNEFKNKINSID